MKIFMPVIRRILPFHVCCNQPGSNPVLSLCSVDQSHLIRYPATTTHQQLTPAEQIATGVTPDYVRLSVGIEDIADIIADLEGP
jgi:hypothetical protein